MDAGNHSSIRAVETMGTHLLMVNIDVFIRYQGTNSRDLLEKSRTPFGL